MLNIEHYRLAPGGEGDGILVGTWKDKPHRLVYDLCDEVARLRASKAELLGAAKKGRDVILETEGRGGRHEVILTQIETAIANAEKGT